LKIYISQGSAATQLRCDGALLQIFHIVCQWKKFVANFLGHPIHIPYIYTSI